MEGAEPVWNGFVIEAFGNHDQQTDTDVPGEYFEDDLLLILGRHRPRPRLGILNETVNTFLQLLMHVGDRLQVVIFVGPTFPDTPRQGLDAEPMRFEDARPGPGPKPCRPSRMKSFRRLLDFEYQIRAVIHGARGDRLRSDDNPLDRAEQLLQFLDRPFFDLRSWI